MKNYTTITELKKAIKIGELQKTQYFYFKGMDCGWDYRFDEGVCDRLRCDPCTDAQSKAYELLEKHLYPKIDIDLT